MHGFKNRSLLNRSLSWEPGRGASIHCNPENSVSQIAEKQVQLVSSDSLKACVWSLDTVVAHTAKVQVMFKETTREGRPASRELCQNCDSKSSKLEVMLLFLEAVLSRGKYVIFIKGGF